jgi:hypothetical protein
MDAFEKGFWCFAISTILILIGCLLVTGIIYVVETIMRVY